ncbi:MAG: hypothetical protein ACO3NN_03735 [Candidatus Puniceispirillales bacterium]|jgi:hypothetical protein|nr:hypothetical protein [Alphaproteobacteria bacterium]
MLNELKPNKNDKQILLNNLNDYIIKIDYYDDNGFKKKKFDIPLKYILANKNNMPSYFVSSLSK